MAGVTAALVFWGGWTPWEAIAVVGGSALVLSLVAVIGLMLMTKRPEDRAKLWQILVETARADLQPFVVLWRFLRGRGP